MSQDVESSFVVPWGYYQQVVSVVDNTTPLVERKA
jgi:hypothetical protein